MLTYSAEELYALNVDRPPPRQVIKTLFTFRLCRPRRRPFSQLPRRSADRSANMVIAWLNVQSLRNKTDAVRETITERSIDVMALSETWHSGSDDACLRLSTPEGYAVVDAARTSGRGGGVAIMFRQHLKSVLLPLPHCRSMEVICVRLITASGPVIVLNVYRPGSEKPSALFFEELTAVFESLVVYSCPVVIGGDFNMHVQDPSDPDARRFASLLSSFDMTQHVHDPTHRQGNTLDLVVTFADRVPHAVSVQPPGAISDHALVSCQLSVAVDSPSLAERLVRGWRRVNRDELRRALEASPLCAAVPDDADVDGLFDSYNVVLTGIADQLAPSHVIRRRPGRPTPWFDTECRAQRRECRRLERRYLRTRCSDDRRQWVDATRRRFQLYRTKKDQYWSDRLLQCGRSSPLIWRSLSSMFSRKQNVTASTNHTADGFADFFEEKVSGIRSATAGLSPPQVTGRAASSLESFEPFTEAELRRIIMASPTKSCSFDPVPTFLLREFIDLLLSYVTSMVNASLVQGRLPVSQKHAVVTPLLKKPGLDTGDMSNYRPVSNLSFVSKVVERAVAKRLNDYLVANDLLPKYQSAYRKKHSTETAMLRVWSDMLSAADTRQVTLLGLLDLSAAFDCVDHVLLLQRLEFSFGLTGTALRWLQSFLTDRTHQVAYGSQLSTVRQLLFGVPQGSVLGPLLYVLYTAELGHVVERHGMKMKLHQYADDSQLYISVAVSSTTAAVQTFTACLSDINAWMSASRLRLNPSKTQVMWLGSGQLISRIDITDVPVLSTQVHTVESARDLGVIIDSQLTLSAHVTALCQSGYYHLRQLRPAVRSLSTDAAKTLVQAFITCRLDYCNSLMYGITDSLVRKVQSVQNAAARLVSGARRCDRITPVLRELHWLPVRQRIRFKVGCLMYKSLSGQAPQYLADDVQLVADSGRRLLRSANDRTCVVPRTNTSFGDRSFSAAGPRVWNDLPPELRQDISFGQFKRKLKSHLFGL